MEPLMEKVENAVDRKTYKVFTWKGEGGTWRNDIYEGGGFFAFRKRCYRRVVQPPHVDFMNMTLQQLSSIDGTPILEEQAERLHAELILAVKTQPPESWKMTGQQIKADEESSSHAISEYSRALKARILHLMDKEGMIRH